MKKTLFTILFVSVSLNSLAGGRGDDPLLAKLIVDQLETRSTDGHDPKVFEAEAWVGKDLNKFWIKADIEQTDGKTEEVELQFLYSKAIAPYWDFQVGWRHDNIPAPTRDWLAFGVKGVAPYFFEVDAAAFIGKHGRIGLRLDAEYEILFTQKLILTPEISVDFHSKEDAVLGVGSGLSSSEAGLRLRYELMREFAPYIGVNWDNTYGDTKDFSRAAGEEVSDTQFVLGIRAML